MHHFMMGLALPMILGRPASPAARFAPDGGATTTLSADELRKLLATRDEELTKAIAEAKTEIARVGTASTQTAEQLDKVSKDHQQITDALTLIEQKLANAGGKPAGFKSVGQRFTATEEFQAALKAGRGEQTGKITVGGFDLASNGFGAVQMLNATGQNQPLVPDLRVPGIIYGPDRMFTIRDLLPQGRTVSNLVQFARELVFTNAAATQAETSPPRTEGALKPESGITFELANAPVATIAHWLPASRQVLDDAPMLESYIDQRMRYGLKLEEEDQLLNGDGTGANINGLVTQATTYNRGATSDTRLDTLRKAILQARLAEYPVDGIVLHPVDWADIELLKDTTNRYIIGDPRGILTPRIWGRPVVETTAMTERNFLAGAFALGAQIWDRWDATVEIARQHADFFIRNMVAILCEERLALTVYRPAAFVKGTFP